MFTFGDYQLFFILEFTYIILVCKVIKSLCLMFSKWKGSLTCLLTNNTETMNV